MNLNAKPDWIGTPRQHAYEENGIQHKAVSVDFTLENDDNRYKLVMQTTIRDGVSSASYELKQYGTAPGRQKPFMMDTDYVWEDQTIPLIDTILNDPYVQSFL
ncbi:DUF3910 family protein [Ectobacillus panaciterrae]|uniref:DUF3910 family protein n=1 Tax=Ectobacillus panaciterrae TaxID=363872 RepID=UPI00041B448B